MKNILRFVVAMIFAFSFCYNSYAMKNGEEKMTNEVRASHILVMDEDEAKNLKTRIEEGAITFEDAAKQYSKCPSGRNGGDLGYFTRGQMVKPFEDAAFSAREGDVTEPIKTQFGWHLIKVTAKD